MGCSDGREPPSVVSSAAHAAEIHAWKQRLDEVTAHLCSVCRVVEEHVKDQTASVGSSWDLLARAGVSEWWGRHKAADARRIEIETLEREQIEIAARLARLREAQNQK